MDRPKEVNAGWSMFSKELGDFIVSIETALQAAESKLAHATANENVEKLKLKARAELAETKLRDSEAGAAHFRQVLMARVYGMGCDFCKKACVEAGVVLTCPTAGRDLLARLEAETKRADEAEKIANPTVSGLNIFQWNGRADKAEAELAAARGLLGRREAFVLSLEDSEHSARMELSNVRKDLEAAKAEILRLMSEVERLEGPAFTARAVQPEAPRREP